MQTTASPAPADRARIVLPSGGDVWPALSLAEWRDTYNTLHMWTQIIGKIPLSLAPMVNEWWQVALYTTARGLTTAPIPLGFRTFEIEFDFVDHNLVIRTSEGATRALALVPRTVADFYREVLAMLRTLDIDVHFVPKPVEVAEAIPFLQDYEHHSYDHDAVRRWWQITRQMDVLFRHFRARFVGKCSPVHFYWGSFDLSVERFSGRRAPARPGADKITRFAYDQEVSTLGFWPGSGTLDGPALYSYTTPEPAGFSDARVRPSQAFYSRELKEFILRYEDVRRAERPADMVLDFAQSTYEAGAMLAKWDREALEWAKYPPDVPSSPVKSDSGSARVKA